MPTAFVRGYVRNGHSVQAHSRGVSSHRGSFRRIKKQAVYNTTYVKGSHGLFRGRKSVSGYGDGTGILRERKGRIVGRASI